MKYIVDVERGLVFRVKILRMNTQLSENLLRLRNARNHLLFIKTMRESAETGSGPQTYTSLEQANNMGSVFFILKSRFFVTVALGPNAYEIVMTIVYQ